ncbi:FAD-binding domain-containing protein [Westerdykella ornata]|uniref:FAD-binding domain-containing protein n=1 Tax=Westerdykella ornata TaxID=318751 RepID=A0A6A6JSM4_WESOR|nr:FAD-binding domain-containing protein [Westerdykella ornata]KAF2279265.1 FAD-binding domain-containing protein [Westerdykella ornata]
MDVHCGVTGIERMGMYLSSLSRLPRIGNYSATMLSSLPLYLAFLTSALAVNFEWETTQLTPEEVNDYYHFRFEEQQDWPRRRECKAIPDEKDKLGIWADFEEWLEGALLKPAPLASVCYYGLQYDAAQCEQLRRSWTSMNLHSNHPSSVMSQWSSGSSCVPTTEPNSTCTLGGYPVFVVNATTVRHIQLAVNFARQMNFRLVIKNSGHDFNGKSIGGNALSIWVHNLKGYKFYENYTTPSYSGPAVAYAGGFQSLEVPAVSERHNVTIITAGGPTVGIAGGFLQGGGHSSFTSYYGLAADHVLSIQAVVASGHFVTCSETENPNLFWAFRGGGGGTFGVITSVVVKAFPRTPITSGSITFSTVPPPGSNQTAISLETFWMGMRAHWAFVHKIVDAGGLGYNFIRHTRNGNTTGLTYTTSISLPNSSPAEYRALVRPHLEELNALGISIPIPSALAVKRSYTYHPSADSSLGAPPTHLAPRALGDVTGHTHIASRLFSRSNFAPGANLEALHQAIRNMVDADKGGYTFHGMNYGPSLPVSGNPNNAVNPAFRTALMHAQAYEENAWWDTTAPVRSREELKKRHDRLQFYMDTYWKAITPGGGSYMNEGDMQEPDWQQAFYGSNYARLKQIKRKWDRHGLFWVIGGVGSEEWEIRESKGGKRREGLVTQDGVLCPVERGS